MLDDLKYYFDLTTEYRSKHSNIILRTVIIQERLPQLQTATRSQYLKNAIGRFLMENTDAAKHPHQRGQ